MPIPCPHCGKTVDPAALVCLYCNGALAPSVLCPACNRPVSEGRKTCQYCDAPVDPARRGFSEPPKSPPAFHGSEGEAPEPRKPVNWGLGRGRGPGPGGRLLDAVLFVLMTPVAVPIIAVNFMMAKKWGRIPVAFIIPEMLFLMLFSLAVGPLLLSVSAVGCVALLVLNIRRAWVGSLDYGIFLGYSNLVVFLMTVGGLLALISGGSLASSMRSDDSIPAPEIPDSVEERTIDDLAASPGPGFQNVRLKPAKIDWSRKIFRVENGEHPGFSITDPIDLPVQVNADQLLQRREELLGSYVGLYANLDRKEVAIEWLPETKRVDGPGRAAAAADKEALVWVVSRRIDSKRLMEAKPLAGSIHPGVVLPMDDATLRQLKLRPGPARLTVRVGPSASPSNVSICAPIDGSSHRVWIAVPGRQPPPPGQPIEGIIETVPFALDPILRGHVRQFEPQFSGTLQLLTAVKPSDFRRLRGIRAEAGRNFPAHWAGLLALGVAMLGLAVWRASVE